MRSSLRILFFLLILALQSPGQSNYQDWFLNKALRIDYMLGGDSESQRLYLTQLVEEPHWSGSYSNTIDSLSLGDFRVKVTDSESGQLIYSNGFCTLFQEWQTIEESKHSIRAFEQVTRVPYPKQKVQITFYYRNKTDGEYLLLSSFEVDPNIDVIKKGIAQQYPVKSLLYNGPSEGKLDLVFIAEGYTDQEMAKFIDDATSVTDYILSKEPFKQHRADINIWAIKSPSEDSEPSNPSAGVWSNTAVGSSFFTFGIERYLTTSNYSRTMDIAANAPSDAICILVNSSEYGGGGIYNHYSISTVDHIHSLRVIIHELGHSLAGLADEYYTSDVAYQEFYPLQLEPWEPNITTLVDFSSKWADMLEQDTPVPTPNTHPYNLGIGVFEGAGYSPTGIYRPYTNCIMKSNNAQVFCPVCRRAIARVIESYLDNAN